MNTLDKHDFLFPEFILSYKFSLHLRKGNFIYKSQASVSWWEIIFG